MDQVGRLWVEILVLAKFSLRNLYLISKTFIVGLSSMSNLCQRRIDTKKKLIVLAADVPNDQSKIARQGKKSPKDSEVNKLS